MKEMLISAGFSDINIQVKENAGDIIKDWMPGSNAEKYVTSVYVTATKRADAPHMVDNVRNCCGAEAAPAPGCSGPSKLQQQRPLQFQQQCPALLKLRLLSRRRSRPAGTEHVSLELKVWLKFSPSV